MIEGAGSARLEKLRKYTEDLARSVATIQTDAEFQDLISTLSPEAVMDMYISWVVAKDWMTRVGMPDDILIVYERRVSLLYKAMGAGMDGLNNLIKYAQISGVKA